MRPSTAGSMNRGMPVCIHYHETDYETDRVPGAPHTSPLMAGLAGQVRRDFADGSPLAAGLPGYAHREEQIRLSTEIAEIIDNGGILLAEAETGTGKTLAYLLPALRCSEKILVSTHTRALQDQLVHRDLPAVQKALGVQRRIALLKGRANYLCPQRLKLFLTSQQLEMWAQKPMLQVLAWSEKSRDGDLSALDFDVFAKGIGHMVTATADQCPGSKCDEFEHCPLMKARQRAQGADIVVTNHSLLLADAALKSGDFGEVLPAFDLYIVDEAHALPDVACQHFGVQLSRMRFIHWFNDMQAVLDETGDEPELKKDIAALAKQILDAYVRTGLDEVAALWPAIWQLADSRRERSDDLARLAERAERISSEILMVREPAEGFVGWADGSGEQRRYTVAPVETGPVLFEHLWQRPASFVLLSATLRVSGTFVYARQRLGLDEAQEAFHPSPFDYTSQAMIYLPRSMPDPRSAGAWPRLPMKWRR